MRYITPHDTLLITQTDGKARYRFKQGILIVGDATTNVGAANFIDVDDATNFSKGIQRVFDTDLKGATTISIERCGLGSLTGLNYAGTSLDNLVDGYKGYFFEAPSLTGGTAVPAEAGIRYRVVVGTITYNSVAYTAGQEFETDGTNTSTGADTSAIFHLVLPTAITKKCNPFRDEQFKIKSLKNGDESNSYWKWDTSGFNPMNSMTSTDANFTGWIR